MRTKLAWLTTQRLLVAILFVSIFAMAARVQVDTDTWWHLASGRWMVEHGQVLKHDPFSHTVPGKPRVQHGWLVQILPIRQTFSDGSASALLITSIFPKT